MSREEQRLQNRKRCLTTCKHYGLNICPLVTQADTFKIDKCILEYDQIKSIRLGSLDEFIFNRTPLHYLKYLGWKEKGNYPKVGQVCVTLVSGFSSIYPGKFVKVIKEDNIQIFLEDVGRVREKHEYCVEKSNWFEQLYKVDVISLGKEE